MGAEEVSFVVGSSNKEEYFLIFSASRFLSVSLAVGSEVVLEATAVKTGAGAGFDANSEEAVELSTDVLLMEAIVLGLEPNNGAGVERLNCGILMLASFTGSTLGCNRVATGCVTAAGGTDVDGFSVPVVARVEGFGKELEESPLFEAGDPNIKVVLPLTTGVGVA